MYVVFSSWQMEICFFITCYRLSHGHNLRMARRYRAIFSNFSIFFHFFLFETLSNTYLDLFWWFVGEKMHLSKKKSLVYFSILVAIKAYQRKWYQNIDFEFFPNFFIIFANFLVLNVNIYDWARDSLKKYHNLLQKIFSSVKISFFRIYVHGTASPQNSK